MGEVRELITGVDSSSSFSSSLLASSLLASSLVVDSRDEALFGILEP
jgi:hypothetical protein